MLNRLTYIAFEAPTFSRTLESIAAVVCPPDLATLHLGPRVVDHAAESLRSLPTYMQIATAAGLKTYELGARLVLRHRGRCASKLTLPLARRYFDDWYRSDLIVRRQFAKSIKGFLCLAYYEQPEVQKMLGYDPHEWIKRVANRRRAQHADSIAEHNTRLLSPEPLIVIGRNRTGASDG